MRLILFVFMMLAATPAYFWAAAPARAQESCGCTPAPFESRWHSAAAVFAGTVTDIKVIEEFRKPAARDLPVEVTILIDNAYKGAENGKKFVLHTSLTRDTCTGYPFEQWKKYLIFAYARKAETYELWSLYNFPSGTLDVGGLCGGTAELSSHNAMMDLAPLQALQKEAEAKARRDAAEKKKSKIF